MGEGGGQAPARTGLGREAAVLVDTDTRMHARFLDWRTGAGAGAAPALCLCVQLLSPDAYGALVAVVGLERPLAVAAREQGHHCVHRDAD